MAPSKQHFVCVCACMFAYGKDLDGLSYDTETLGGVVSIVTVKVTSVLTVICEAVNQLGQDKRELSVEPSKSLSTSAV